MHKRAREHRFHPSLQVDGKAYTLQHVLGHFENLTREREVMMMMMTRRKDVSAARHQIERERERERDLLQQKKSVLSISIYLVRSFSSRNGKQQTANGKKATANGKRPTANGNDIHCGCQRHGEDPG
jgi:hypothetical protein